jgi:hypothetical protein
MMSMKVCQPLGALSGPSWFVPARRRKLLTCGEPPQMFDILAETLTELMVEPGGIALASKRNDWRSGSKQ